MIGQRGNNTDYFKHNDKTLSEENVFAFIKNKYLSVDR